MPRSEEGYIVLEVPRGPHPVTAAATVVVGGWLEDVDLSAGFSDGPNPMRWRLAGWFIKTESRPWKVRSEGICGVSPASGTTWAYPYP